MREDNAHPKNIHGAHRAKTIGRSEFQGAPRNPEEANNARILALTVNQHFASEHFGTEL